MKDAFVDRKFSAANTVMIETINGILDEYKAQRFKLSLRQLYYQLVARDLIENSVRSYKNIGSLVSNARQAGMIDWNMIEDRGRDTVALNHWNSPAEIVSAAARQFRIDKWANQPWHVELMVEKDALSGVLVPTCNSLDIAITANKGYSSSSTMYEIGQRLADKFDSGKKICIIYLGDHDPSGIDMTRDVDERLGMYSRLDSSIKVSRIALNMDQIEQWQPPENPAKETDARFKSYRIKYGDKSWELDAVEPVRLAGLVTNIVKEHRDETLWAVMATREAKMRDDLEKFAQEYRENEVN